MADYTTTGLISNLKSRGFVPTSQNTFQTSDFLQILNDELRTTIVPLIESAEQEYFVTTQDISVTAGTDTYSLPSGAISTAIKGVFALTNNDLTQLQWVSVEQISHVPRPQGVWLKNSKMVFYPSPTTSFTARVFYYLRPKELVATSTCALVTAVGGSTVTVSSVPSGWTTGTSVDAISATPPHESLGDAISITGIASTTITLTVPSGLAVGDYLAPAGQSPFAQIPLEAQPVLCQAAAVECLRRQSDPSLENALGKYQKMADDFIAMISPRIDGSVRKANNLRNVFTWVG